ncbi:MAG TPA: hypothetical protein VFQ67_04995, partial [Allosphingosinicella sp.]|nr:hypothetical protein [Allosphingosinicella sp.]
GANVPIRRSTGGDERRQFARPQAEDGRGKDPLPAKPVEKGKLARRPRFARGTEHEQPSLVPARRALSAERLAPRGLAHE